MSVAVEAGQLRDGMANTFTVGLGLGGVLRRTAEGALGYLGMALPESTLTALRHTMGLGEVSGAAITRAAALEAAAPKAAAELGQRGPVAVVRDRPSVLIVPQRADTAASPKGPGGMKPA